MSGQTAVIAEAPVGPDAAAGAPVLDPRVIGPYPLPAGRRRWRITLHSRPIDIAQTPGSPTTIPLWNQTIIAELVNARGRQLVQQQNVPAQMTFTLNGRDPDCAAILEMQHEVMMWRWDDFTGADVCMFRGPITQSEDQLTTESHTVTFTALDYLAMLQRRVIGSLTGVTYTSLDQDTIARRIVDSAQYQAPLTGSFTVSALLPLWVMQVNPDGTTRSAAGPVRTRKYEGGSVQGELLDQLANVQGGFEYDVVPNARVTAARPEGNDGVRIFYPQQGTTRTDFMLVYGGNVSSLTRALNSSDFGNYVRVMGNNGSSDPSVAQQAADAFTNNDPQVGVWSSGDNGSSDVNDALTIQQRAAGQVGRSGTLLPSYTLGLRPERYRMGFPNMGDTVTLRVQSGRLNVNTQVRVVGITYDISDDGAEDIQLVVGQPAVSFLKTLTPLRRDINALARR